MSSKSKNVLSLAIGSFIAIGILELFLHFYNPFNNRLVAGKIKLPANVTYTIQNSQIASLPSHIVHSKNSLGFRGQSPDSIANRKKIICLGGSTTECFYLNDGQDWPAILAGKLTNKYWVNNAGLDGHSTFGHIQLLQNHILQLKPQIVIFLIGCNDVAAQQLNNYEAEMINSNKRLLEYSAIFTTIQSIKRASKAKNFGLHHQSVNFLNFQKVDTSNWKSQDLKKPLTLYSKRIMKLINICFQNNIQPVFCTQPSILLHTSLNSTFVGNRKYLNQSAMHYAYQLNSFNTTTLNTCASASVQCIDLATCLAADTQYYYDFFHFTPKGAQAVANCIYNTLKL